MGSLRESISGEVTATRTEGEDGGTLEIPGASIPVFDRSLGNPRERELFMALGPKRETQGGGSYALPTRVARAGFEPATPRFSVVCSTN